MLLVAAVLAALSSELVTGALAAAATAVSAIVASVLAYRRRRRETGGSISTTDADGLWNEAERIRAGMAVELDQLRTLAEKSAEKIQRLQAEMADLAGRLAIAAAEAEICKEREAALRRRIVELEGGSR